MPASVSEAQGCLSLVLEPRNIHLKVLTLHSRQYVYAFSSERLLGQSSSCYTLLARS